MTTRTKVIDGVKHYSAKPAPEWSHSEEPHVCGYCALSTQNNNKGGMCDSSCGFSSVWVDEVHFVELKLKGWIE